MQWAYPSIVLHGAPGQEPEPNLCLSIGINLHLMLVDMEKSDRQSWRRYLRLSLRTLVVLVLVIGGVLGWLANSAWPVTDAPLACLASLTGLQSPTLFHCNVQAQT